MRTIAAMTAKVQRAPTRKVTPFENQSCNLPAPLEDVKRWVGKVCRGIETAEAAKRRLRRASQDVERCRLTKGCDAQHHVQLAQALRKEWPVFL